MKSSIVHSLPTSTIGLRRTVLATSIATLLVLSGGPRAHATSDTWDGSTSAVWSVNTNWLTDPAVVPGTGDTATFSLAAGTVNNNTTISLAGITIKTILFDTASAAAYVLGSGAVNSQAFTLNDAGAITVNSTVANVETFNATINLGTATASTYTVTNNSANTLTFAGTVQGGTGGTAAAKTLAVTGSGNTNFGTVAKGGASGITISKTNAGTVTLGGTADNASVGLTLNGGLVVLNKTSTASVHAIGSNSTITTGTLQLGGSGGDQIFDSNVITVNGGIFDLNGRNETIGALAAAAGGGTAYNSANGSTSTLTVGGGNATGSYAGVIADNAGGGATGIVALTKTGTGTQTLTGVNTYTGGTTINGGTLSVSGSGTLGADVVGNDIVVNAGGNLAISSAAKKGVNQNVTINSSATGLGGLGLGFAPASQAAIPTFTNARTGTTIGGVLGVNTATFSTVLDMSTLGGGGMFLGSQLGGTYTAATLGVDGTTYRLGGGGGTLTVTNAVLNGANDLIVGDARTNGGGTVVLSSGAQTFTGSVTVASGTLSVGTIAIGGNNSGLGAGSTAVALGSATTTGALTYTGATTGTDRGITIGAGGGAVNVNTGGANLTISGLVSSAGGAFTKGGGGTLTLSNASNPLQAVNVTGGTLALTNSGNTATNLTVSGAGVLSLGASGGLNATGNTNIGNGSTNGTVTGVSGASLSLGSGSGSSLTIGTGTLDSNTTTGTLDVSALSTFNVNVGTVAMGDSTASSAVGIGILKLASTTNTITASTSFIVASANSSASNANSIVLGAGQNTINTPIFTFGEAKSGGTLTMDAGGTFTLKGIGAGTTALTIGRSNVTTGTTPAVTADLTTGTFIGTLGPMIVGQKSGGGSGTNNGSVTGTLKIGPSALNNITATSLRIGDATSGATGGSSNTATGTVEFGGGNFAISGTTTIGANASTFSATTATGTFKISGGTVTSGAIALGNKATGGNATGTLNLTGGSLTVSGNITDGGGTSTLTLAGGTLDLTGKNIGAAGAGVIDNLTLASGTLRNVAEINGGGAITKTTAGTLTLAGVNTYTGATNIDDGTVLVSGSISGSAVNVNSGGTLGGGGSITTGNQALTLAAGGKLSPGASVGDLQVNTGSAQMDLSAGVAGTATAALLFELDTLAASDKVTLSGSSVLNIGVGGAGTGLAFDDFVFSNLGGLQAGTYTLFDGVNAILGSFDTTSSLSGSLGGGFTGTLAFGDGGKDIVLLVVPEPGSWAMLLGSAGMLAGLRRFRRRA